MYNQTKKTMINCLFKKLNKEPMSNLFIWFILYTEIFPLNYFVSPSVFDCMVEHMLIIRNSVQVFATIIRPTSCLTLISPMQPKSSNHTKAG